MIHAWMLFLMLSPAQPFMWPMFVPYATYETARACKVAGDAYPNVQAFHGWVCTPVKGRQIKSHR